MAVAHAPSTTSFVIINPATGLEIATYASHADREVQEILGEVGLAQTNWRAPDDRTKCAHEGDRGSTANRRSRNRPDDGA